MPAPTQPPRRGARPFVYYVLLLVALGTGVVAGCERAPSEPAKSPAAGSPLNVLLLLGDTVRADRLSLYGHQRATSPHLERWGSRGRVYERAMSPGIWTLPAHVSLFTGLAVGVHGVDRATDRLEDTQLTLAEIFSEAGYDTFAFSANPFITRENGVLQGFDEVEYAWGERWQRRIHRVIRSRLISGDVNSQRVLSEMDVSSKWTGQAAGPIAQRLLLRWLERRSDERPFFAYVNYMDAHPIWLPSRTARNRMMDAELAAHSLTVRQDGAHFWMGGRDLYSERDLEALRGVYDAALYDWDQAIGTLLDALDAEGWLDNTIVVITSDHGEALGEHGRMGHQFNVHASVSHVPLIIVHRGKIAPERIEEAVSTSGLLLALLDWAEIDGPSAREARALPLGDLGRSPVVTEYTVPNAYQLEKLRKISPARLPEFEQTLNAVEKDGFRLLRASDGSQKLYDVGSDPDEIRNLAAQLPEVVETLSKVVPAPVGASVENTEVTPIAEAQRKRLQALGYLGD